QTCALPISNDITDIDMSGTAHPGLDYLRAAIIDIENVMTDGIDGYDPTIRPEVMVWMDKFLSSGRKFSLLTNCTDVDFVGDVAAQINCEFGKQMTLLPTQSKLHASPYRIACSIMGVAPSFTMLIDDQFKSYRGARKAGIGVMNWTRPYGNHQHSVVRRFRPFEMGLIRPLVAKLPKTLVFETS